MFSVQTLTADSQSLWATTKGRYASAADAVSALAPIAELNGHAVAVKTRLAPSGRVVAVDVLRLAGIPPDGWRQAIERAIPRRSGAVTSLDVLPPISESNSFASAMRVVGWVFIAFVALIIICGCVAAVPSVLGITRDESLLGLLMLIYNPWFIILGALGIVLVAFKFD